MRQAFAHEATVVTAGGGDAGAPGAAITVELCGSWIHEPPCPLAPHYTHAERAGDELHLRTLFVVEPEREDEVRQKIKAALDKGQVVRPDNLVTTWRILSSQAADVVEAEQEHAQRLIDS